VLKDGMSLLDECFQDEKIIFLLQGLQEKFVFDSKTTIDELRPLFQSMFFENNFFICVTSLTKEVFSFLWKKQ